MLQTKTIFTKNMITRFFKFESDDLYFSRTISRHPLVALETLNCVVHDESYTSIVMVS